MMSHVSLRTIQQSFKLKPVCISVGDDVAYLSHDGSEDKHPDQVTNDGEYVPEKRIMKKDEKRKLNPKKLLVKSWQWRELFLVVK